MNVKYHTSVKNMDIFVEQVLRYPMKVTHGLSPYYTTMPEYWLFIINYFYYIISKLLVY